MPRTSTSSVVLKQYLNTLAPLEHLLLDIPANQFNQFRQALLTASLDAILADFAPAQHKESHQVQDLGKRFSVLEMDLTLTHVTAFIGAQFD